MAVALTKTDFQTYLNENLSYLDFSSLAYDQGFLAEAKRIAGALRTLLHDKGRTVSVIKHLELKSK